MSTSYTWHIALYSIHDSRHLQSPDQINNVLIGPDWLFMCITKLITARLLSDNAITFVRKCVRCVFVDINFWSTNYMRRDYPILILYNKKKFAEEFMNNHRDFIRFCHNVEYNFICIISNKSKKGPLRK